MTCESSRRKSGTISTFAVHWLHGPRLETRRERDISCGIVFIPDRDARHSIFSNKLTRSTRPRPHESTESKHLIRAGKIDGPLDSRTGKSLKKKKHGDPDNVGKVCHMTHDPGTLNRVKFRLSFLPMYPELRLRQNVD